MERIAQVARACLRERDRPDGRLKADMKDVELHTGEEPRRGERFVGVATEVSFMRGVIGWCVGFEATVVPVAFVALILSYSSASFSATYTVPHITHS